VPELPVSRRQALVAAAVLLAFMAIAGKLLAGAGAARVEPPVKPSAGMVVAAPAEAEQLVVHVAGAVRKPGLYRLDDGSRVSDAVARAGGATARADTAAVNLAAPLADGIQVVIPSRVAGAAGVPRESVAAPARVSLSSATLAELDALPGVGPVTAQKILDHRARHGAFRAVDDLDAIPGIGPARLEQLRELVNP
jgi:competence protein ComEA